MLTQEETLLSRDAQGKETQENCSATWLAVLDFMTWDQFPGCFWPVTVVQGPSWWYMHQSAKTDSSEDSGMSAGHMDWCLLSSFELSQILQVGGSLLVLYALPEPPVVGQLTDASGYFLAQPGRVVSVSGSPNITTSKQKTFGEHYVQWSIIWKSKSSSPVEFSSIERFRVPDFGLHIEKNLVCMVTVLKALPAEFSGY